MDIGTAPAFGTRTGSGTDYHWMGLCRVWGMCVSIYGRKGTSIVTEVARALSSDMYEDKDSAIGSY